MEPENNNQEVRIPEPTQCRGSYEATPMVGGVEVLYDKTQDKKSDDDVIYEEPG